VRGVGVAGNLNICCNKHSCEFTWWCGNIMNSICGKFCRFWSLCTQEGVKTLRLIPPEITWANSSHNPPARASWASGLLMLRETGERRLNTKQFKSGRKVVFFTYTYY